MKWTILIILIAYFVAMFIIGLIANRKSKTVTDYYVAGRGLGGVITALVYMSSLVSAGALVGWTGQASSYGVWFIFAGCAVTIATYICWAAAFRQGHAPFQKAGSADCSGLPGSPL